MEVGGRESLLGVSSTINSGEIGNDSLTGEYLNPEMDQAGLL